MRINGRALMSLAGMAISAWMVITALGWLLMAGLFPIIIGIPVFFLALAELFFSLSKKRESDPKEESRVDFKLSEDVDRALATRRTISILLWIIGFFILIVLTGFPMAIPLFFFLFLKLKGGKGWKISLGMAALAWGFFYGLFVYLLHIRFWEGWVQQGLGGVGIL